MQSTSADYKTAIASTDREIRGYIKFNNTFTLRGSDGLVSFKTTQNAMDAERYCAGSTTSCFCEASFYNSGLDGSGVSLASSYFDAYIGVCTGELPDADKDYVTVEISAAETVTLTSSAKTLLILPTALTALPNGTEVVLTVNDADYVGVWNSSTKKVTATDGTNYYNLTATSLLIKFSVTDENDAIVAGTYTVAISYRDYRVEYVCCGRYYISEITRGTATTRIVGYDIAGRLSMDYVPTVTPDPDDGYLVMDILNDIIDQTGVNGGTHFTTYGDSTYVAQIFEGNCRAQWGWLCSLVSAKAASYSGTREPADLGYMKEYYAGNGEVNPYAVDETTTYLDGVSFGDEYTITSFTTGTTETPIVIGNGTGVYGLNPYMDNATATTIEGTVDNYQYYPATLHWRGDPAIDIFDEINVTQGVDTYKLIAMKIETTFNGGLEQTINCYGDSANYYALSTSPTQGQINRVSNLVQEIQQAIETADGGVITKILDTDGTWKELVIANNQDLSQATSVWRFNINGLAHSNQYQGGTYTLAMDTQGRIVANVIQTGILQDAQGDNSWNLDTGALTITNGSINITTANDTLDIIQLNYDDRLPNGYGSVYSTSLQSKSIRAEGHSYRPTNLHDASKVVMFGNGFGEYVQVEHDVYSNEQPTEIFSKRYTNYTSAGMVMYSAYGIGAEPVEVGSLPNGTDFADEVTPYSSRCTITYKVCRKFGGFRFIRLLLSSSHTGSNSPRLASVGAGNAPQFANALTCVTYVSDSDVGTAVPCMIGTSGGIYLKSTSSGTNYLVTGYYYVHS